ncbi:MAG: hypothetical protein QM621_02275 [Aeromicrobium sp.]|uniref:hypothetical protein n=1 Tax=Aeromicrobium sp. TaxID=1871063 RepID=UPI0039E460EE
MDYELACDQAEEIDATLDGQERLDAYRQHADALEPGEVGRSVFLEYLADHLTMSKRYDEARSVYVELIADGGDCELDPRVGLLDVELRIGHTDQADALLKELLASARADELDLADYADIGGALEEAGEFRKAHRWFTMPLRDLDPEELEFSEVPLLHGRARVRRALGLPVDAYDEVSQAITGTFAAGDDA